MAIPNQQPTPLLKLLISCCGFTAAVAAAIMAFVWAAAAFVAPSGAPDLALLLGQVFGLGVHAVVEAWTCCLWVATAGTYSIAGMSFWFYAAMAGRMVCYCMERKLTKLPETDEVRRWTEFFACWNVRMSVYAWIWVLVAGILGLDYMTHALAEHDHTDLVMIGAKHGTFEHLLGVIAYLGSIAGFFLLIFEGAIRTIESEAESQSA